MINRLYHHIRRLFDTPSIEEVAAYQHKMPGSIRVKISYDKKTKLYTATIAALDKQKVTALLITESRGAARLVENVNDLLLTYLDIPERIKPSMPRLLPEDIDYANQLMKSPQLVLAK
ncbi:MAG: hypothetical protein Q4B05_01385 [Candidatus Saccharibacteria bacterium]|nr:hypothetical protein [Candidatus Saccharibacteria bacterium]